ncbi:MAG: asparagine synthetase B, partial [Candidatus Thioglobus sp.]|nr:asparagine synthetase B [Candidatus Thioglobus sp.]
MCAIIGIASSTPVYSRDWLIAGRDSMRHRGPDDKGEWWSNDNSVGFAHRRLSIIDESSAGHQPMRNSVGDVTVVFNGEIYNFRDLKTELSLAGHKFITHCDTEVLIAAWREWGSDCVKHLNGMFAFAIHDAKF